MRGLALLIILASALVVTPLYSQDSTTQLKGPKGSNDVVQGRTIGPIKPTDTLWRIAAKVRPSNAVSIYQVMQALYNKNPNSFLEQNLNHMRSGSFLKVPSLAEIRNINPKLAKQRSEKDDELWEKKKNATSNTSEVIEGDIKGTQALKADVDDAKKILQQELNEIKTEQSTKLVELQQQFKNSVNNVEEIVIENNNLKKQLTGISQELEKVRLQLDQDSEIQQQLKDLIEKQNQIIIQEKETESEEGMLSNPLVLSLLMTIPALLIIFAIVMFLRKRSNNDEGEFPPEMTNLDGNNLSSESFDKQVEPEIADDLSVQLDDSLESEMLPDDEHEFTDSLDDNLDDASESDLLDQDELESLLKDDVVFADEDIDGDDNELDIFMQQDFDNPLDNNSNESIDLESSEIEGDILTSDVLDSLFDADESSSGNDNEEDNSLESYDEMAALSEELANDSDDFDIDSLIDEAGESEEAALGELSDDVDASLVEESDEFDLDDIDSLIDEAGESEDSAVGELSDDVDTSLVEEVDEFDLDDIDSLIDEA
ncbi:FimV/HubP family polar landmark protein, partial [Pseudoalteromonas aliena]|uniref:FimV/HubP family polar landmark protein n=1 Tax=Pseudoalteromonas aliena TaxID=247523 RepID=UPI00311F1CDB